MLKSTLIIDKRLLVYASTIEETMLKPAWQIWHSAYSMNFVTQRCVFQNEYHTHSAQPISELVHFPYFCLATTSSNTPTTATIRQHDDTIHITHKTLTMSSFRAGNNCSARCTSTFGVLVSGVCSSNSMPFCKSNKLITSAPFHDIKHGSIIIILLRTKMITISYRFTSLRLSESQEAFFKYTGNGCSTSHPLTCL
jgi:hypothetical protein